MTEELAASTSFYILVESTTAGMALYSALRKEGSEFYAPLTFAQYNHAKK